MEIDRLLRQARLLHNSGTRWLFAQAGLSAGMRVMDVGSGAGDVALLAAECVGPSGRVVGIDSSPTALEIARERAAAAGLRHVHFIDGDLHAPPVEERFDAIVGRSVLAHLSDPVEALRGLLRYLKPGGIVAFREIDTTLGMYTAIPPSPTLEMLSHAMLAPAETMRGRAAPANPRMGFSLVRVFMDAGLPFPQMSVDTAVGGAAGWEGYSYLADMARLVSAVTSRAGLPVPAGLENPAAFAAQVEAEVVAARGVIKLQDSVNAWVHAET
jgi:hypothetical protein